MSCEKFELDNGMGVKLKLEGKNLQIDASWLNQPTSMLFVRHDRKKLYEFLKEEFECKPQNYSVHPYPYIHSFPFVSFSFADLCPKPVEDKHVVTGVYGSHISLRKSRDCQDEAVAYLHKDTSNDAYMTIKELEKLNDWITGYLKELKQKENKKEQKLKCEIKKREKQRDELNCEINELKCKLEG